MLRLNTMRTTIVMLATSLAVSAFGAPQREAVQASVTPFSQMQAIYEQAAAAQSVDEIDVLIDSSLTLEAAELRRDALWAAILRLDEITGREQVISSLLRVEAADACSCSVLTIRLFTLWASRDPHEAVRWMRDLPPTLADNALRGIRSALGEDRSDLLGMLAEYPSGPETEKVWSNALHWVAQEEPALAFYELHRLTSDDARKRTLHAIAKAWGERDPDAALRVDWEQLDAGERKDFQYQLLTSAARHHPTRLAYWLSQSTVDSRRSNIIYAAGSSKEHLTFEQWTAIAHSLPRPADREHAMRSAVNNASAEDPVFVLDWLANEGDRGLYGKYGWPALSKLAEKDMDAALSTALDLHQIEPDWYGNLLKKIAESDVIRALQLASNLTNQRIRDEAMKNVLRSAGETEHLLALTLVDRLRNTKDQTNARETILREWSKVALEDAMAWMIENADLVSDSSWKSLSGQLAEVDPSAAMDATARIPVAAQGAWIHGLLRSIARYAPERSFWLQEYAHLEGYSNWVSELAKSLAGMEPETAIALVESLPDDKRAPAVSNVITSLASHHAELAAGWIATRRGVEGYEGSIRNLTRVWMHNDLAAALDHARQLPNGPAKDAALVALTASEDLSEDELIEIIGMFNDPAQLTRHLPYLIKARYPELSREEYSTILELWKVPDSVRDQWF